MFTLGFKKIAAMDHNNQGLEFKTSDQTSGNTGAGGMAPSGVPTYQPMDDNPKGSSKRRKRPRAEVARLLFDKMGSGGSDIASGTVDQLKWTSESGPTLEQEADDRKEQKNRRKAYVRARLK